MEETTNINVNEEVVETTEETTAEAKLYTAEEVAKMVQAESDRRTNQALATQKKKYEKQLSLSKLDGAERERAEDKNRIAELEELVKQMDTERNRSELKTVLSTRGLSAEFADIISINDDIAASQANIDKLDKLFKAAVKAEVERRLAGNAPKAGAASAEPTKETAKKMSLVEIQALANNNPELYKKLFN